MKNIIRIFIVAFISFGIIGGCGGGEGDGLFVNGGGGFRKEVNCKNAFDNNSTFCSTFNPGVCCERFNCGFFSCSISCAPELGLCCQKGFNLCPSLDICVKDISQCPGAEEPLDSGVSISEVEEAFCTESMSTGVIGAEHNIQLNGIAYGPVGTEVNVHFPDFPDIDINVSCFEWGEFINLTGKCIREEGNPPATSWYFTFPQNDFIDKPAPEFDIIIFTDSSSDTFTQEACP